jgi:uncharacterized membrane-anchored protein
MSLAAVEAPVARHRVALTWGGLLLVISVLVALVAHKEQVLRDGKAVLLPLAPVDPRSLIEGDYMTLRYAIAADPGWPPDGKLLVRKDENGVGRLVGRYEEGTPVGPDEVVLRYRRRRWQTRLGAEAYYFQEGTADRYAKARYGELRVAPSGESVLVGLRDEGREPLLPASR